MNQQASASGPPPVGFLNPLLYQIGQSPLATSAFHDITEGNNSNTFSSNRFHAAPGYDLCTGWGSPKGNNLIQLLAFSGSTSGLTAPPVLAPDGGIFVGSATVEISDQSPGARIYYTLDGSNPTPQSTLYTDALEIAQSATLRAIAIKPGWPPSQVVAATYIQEALVGQGNGLTAFYWSSQTDTNGIPSLVRIDPTVNFNWSNQPPVPATNDQGFAVIWSGQVQPQFSELYTFYAPGLGGVTLFVGDRFIISNLQGQATPSSGSIPLVAGQKYPIQMLYFTEQLPAYAQLSWSSQTLLKQVIPESQLYPATDLPYTLRLSNPVFFSGGPFQLSVQALPGRTFFLQVTTNWVDWTTVSSNFQWSSYFQMVDPSAGAYSFQFYRVVGGLP